jgi:ABC-type Fe3+ transport system permease subunit
MDVVVALLYYSNSRFFIVIIRYPRDELLKVDIVRRWHLYGSATTSPTCSFFLLFCCYVLLVVRRHRWRTHYYYLELMIEIIKIITDESNVT